jgi:hypothetical protein
VKDHNRHRLALIDARFGDRRGAPSETEAFEEAFERVCLAVIRPVMEDVAAELEQLGHAPRIATEPLIHEGDRIAPCIALYLGLRGRGEGSGYVALGVARDGVTPNVLAWLVAEPTPFDLQRYARPDEISADTVEQMLVDAVEHLFARSAR